MFWIDLDRGSIIDKGSVCFSGASIEGYFCAQYRILVLIAKKFFLYTIHGCILGVYRQKKAPYLGAIEKDLSWYASCVTGTVYHPY